MVCAYCRAVERVERQQRDKHDDEWAEGRFWFARDYDPQQDKTKPKSTGARKSTKGERQGPRRMAR